MDLFVKNKGVGLVSFCFFYQKEEAMDSSLPVSSAFIDVVVGTSSEPIL